VQKESIFLGKPTQFQHSSMTYDELLPAVHMEILVFWKVASCS